MRIQALALAILILLSIATVKYTGSQDVKNLASEKIVTLGSQNDFSYQKASLKEINEFSIPRAPSRNWSVLDPTVRSESVLIHSFSDNFSFLSYNTYKAWPAASLTKIMTAVVVLEEIGKAKKIEISENAVSTEGVAGGLKTGDVYITEDLLKIMLLTSSNDAATAFEVYLGKDEFVRKMNKKATDLGMINTIFHDASGLSDLNETSANDVLALIKYVLENHPEILSWTRIQSITLQPLNTTVNQTIYNINALSKESDFLGGKTGTSDEAGKNLASVFSFRDRKLAVIILGSENRAEEVENVLSWVENAYAF